MSDVADLLRELQGNQGLLTRQIRARTDALTALEDEIRALRDRTGDEEDTATGGCPYLEVAVQAQTRALTSLGQLAALTAPRGRAWQDDPVAAPLIEAVHEDQQEADLWLGNGALTLGLWRSERDRLADLSAVGVEE